MTNSFVKSIFVCLALGAIATSCLKQADKEPVTITASETPEAIAVRASDKTFTEFSHSIPEHKKFECNSCHRREGKANDLKFAGHDSCVGCHISQFTNPEQQTMCVICHSDMNATPPPTKEFPTKFEEGFNMKFVHASHVSGEGRPPEGCASCHESAGAGKTIPVGVEAHTNCYTCHTPDKKIGSCNVCHELAPYRRTPPGRYVFKAVFSHREHSGAQGLNCADCHTVRAGQQGSQVSTIVAQEHNGAGNSCASCHNGSRAFGGNDVTNMASCKRCHSGSGFNMLPGSPF
ncbi:MAG TPA: cytochrome c3 family protein [Pyrinomonadaceae bacterium]|nr:cytochrome c3 family protein [Pyrinomonadaceae bacterium]